MVTAWGPKYFISNPKQGNRNPKSYNVVLGPENAAVIVAYRDGRHGSIAPCESINPDNNNTDFAPEGRKDDSGKLRYDLIPVGSLEEVVKVYTMGANKYGDRNWEKGIRWGRIFAAMMRHAWAWWRGERNDPVDGQHHLASVAWCCLTLMEYERTHPELDNREGI